jgi:hypothetical protein
MRTKARRIDSAVPKPHWVAMASTPAEVSSRRRRAASKLFHAPGRRHSHRPRKHPGEIARAHRRPASQGLDRKILLEVVRHPRLKIGDARVIRQLLLELGAELGLSSRSMEEEHELSRHRAREGDSMIFRHETEREIHPGGDSRRGVDAPLLDEDRIGLDREPGVLAGEAGTARPVRGDALAVEEARFCQNERAGAYGSQPANAGGSHPAKPGDQRSVSDGRLGAPAAGHQQGVQTAADVRESARRDH